VKPFLKWAGGKRWLFSDDFVAKLPSFDRYVEPFLGGAAGFFAIEPKNALLSDVNPELINVYDQIRFNPQGVARGLKFLHTRHSKDLYYKIRHRGYNALIRYLRDAYLAITTKPEVPSKDQFRSLLDRSTLTDGDFTVDRYKPGSSGAAELYRDLVASLPEGD
jgi:site-specific DNA-adenine methylase